VARRRLLISYCNALSQTKRLTSNNLAYRHLLIATQKRSKDDDEPFCHHLLQAHQKKNFSEKKFKNYEEPWILIVFYTTLNYKNKIKP